MLLESIRFHSSFHKPVTQAILIPVVMVWSGQWSHHQLLITSFHWQMEDEIRASLLLCCLLTLPLLNCTGRPGCLWPTDLVQKWGVGVLRTDHLERESPELFLLGGGEGRGVSLPTLHLSLWGVAVSPPVHLTSLIGPASLMTLFNIVLVVPAWYCLISTLDSLFHLKKIPHGYYYWKGIKYRDQFRENWQM